MESNDLQYLKQQLEESKKQQQELEDKVQSLSDFIENGSLPLHWVDKNGIIIWANKAELDSLGYAKDEYVGRHINEFHADSEVIGDILKRLSGKETILNYPARLKCKDGSIKHVLINSNVLWKDEEFVHTRCFTRDITLLKLEEDKKKLLLIELGVKHEELNRYMDQLKAAHTEVEAKVKFRNLELEKIVNQQKEEIARLKAALGQTK